MGRKLLLFISSLFVIQYSFSQPPATWTSADMYLAIRKLNVLGSVMYMAAHPDDENTRLLAFFSKDRLYRTGYLSLTRGDGGQNLIGDEQRIRADAVWIIRKFQPEIIITRFPDDQRAGHGQHSASAVIARKAFAAA